MTKTCLVTGGAGFIGSHLVEYLLAKTNWNITVWDKLTYASVDGRGDPWRLEKFFANPQFEFYPYNVCYPHSEKTFNYIVHLAAETHVETSIKMPRHVFSNNVEGTFEMLQFANRQPNLEKFLYFSTDEVFGEAESEPFTEWARYNSSNPYSASKAAGEELTLAWGRTYRLPVVITHCCNVFGEKQHEEKFIPKIIGKILRGETVSIHHAKNPMFSDIFATENPNEIGMRQYVYAGDVARAVALILNSHTASREKFNIVGNPVSNIAMFTLISNILEKTDAPYKLEIPTVDRPGWDMRYSIADSKLEILGWRPYPDFVGLLKKTVEYYKCAK